MYVERTKVSFDGDAMRPIFLLQLNRLQGRDKLLKLIDCRGIVLGGRAKARSLGACWSRSQCLQGMALQMKISIAFPVEAETS